mmetsp:Transcript_3252/g.4509  ORF Transcript_3252/g.4509 Transcript_3252/m.4509 type:complete len:103 (-) Transcript_3252:1507-1815(-)
MSQIIDPLGLLPPIESVLYSSEEPSVSGSESTFSALPSRGSNEDESLNALLLRFNELNDRVDILAEESVNKEIKRKSQRPSKRQRRSAAKKRDQGFEGPIAE